MVPSVLISVDLRFAEIVKLNEDVLPTAGNDHVPTTYRFQPPASGDSPTTMHQKFFVFLNKLYLAVSHFM